MTPEKHSAHHPLLEPAQALLDQLTADRSGEEPSRIVDGVSDPRLVLQDFMPAGLSLEWEIGALHWRSAGVRPFVKNEVPFLINNDGLLSALAAAVLFANGREVGASKPIHIVEFGAGSGLFARFFLDEFRDLCNLQGTDDYERLTYFVTDASPRTVADWVERGLFSEHGAHAVPAICNAERMEEIVTVDGSPLVLPDLRAVFCNYVLDVLPCTLVRRGGGATEELNVRTLISADQALLSEYTLLTPGEIQGIARSGDPAERARLEPLMALFDFETRFKTVSRTIPYLDEAVAWGVDGGPVVLNHGALALLERVASRLDPEGFILINDYGATERSEQAAHGVAQRFGATSANGINFPFLGDFIMGRGLKIVVPPEDGGRSIHTRLITRRSLPSTEQTFQERFAAESIQALDAPAQQARAAVAAGSYGEALDRYRDAIAQQPRNWRLLGDIAEFVLFEIKDAPAALELARRAVELNPNLSAWLWNILGDALWVLERHADAHTAYLEAINIDPDDPRTLLNLSYTLLQQVDAPAALEAIARGLAKDKSGLYRDRLLAKQQHILSAISTAAGRERERAMLRLTRLQAEMKKATP